MKKQPKTLVTTSPPTKEIATAPASLGQLGAEKWRQILKSGRTIRNLDVLQAYCLNYQRWMEMEEWLADPSHGLIATIRDDKGNIKSHGPAPQLAISERSSKEMTRLGKSLGLNA